MTVDTNNAQHIIAAEGKVFRRKSDGTVYGEEIYLGKSYYEFGKLLETPHDDVPEDFEEIDKPEEPKMVEEDDEMPRHPRHHETEE